MNFRFDKQQQFTCQQCSRCCRRGWDVALTTGEVEAYRKVKAARWFREEPEVEQGRDPFEAIPGHAGAYRLRKRKDGICGFLSEKNRCRIHEELGGDRKPLACRLFPFRVHPVQGEVLVTASFSCPTVGADTGATLESQAETLHTLGREWLKQFPEPESSLLFTEGHPIGVRAAEDFRTMLRRMLDRRKADGSYDLRENMERMAHYCEDLTRHRVLRLSKEAFAEYLVLTGKHMATSDKPLTPRFPSRLARLLFRGFVFAVIAVQSRLQDGRTKGLRLSLRWRLLRVLAHLHGLGPSLEDVSLPAMRQASFPVEDPAIAGLLYNYLRGSIETLGTGRSPLIDELGFAVAQLNAACALAAMRSGIAGATSVSANALAQGLLEASDLSHAGIGTGLTGGIESLFLFASGLYSA